MSERLRTTTPASDGDPGYKDKGLLGTYQTADGDFPDPEGLKRFAGFGADEADLTRGFKKVDARELPIYDLANHKEKWTQPRVPDEDSDGGEDMPQDIQFRRQDRETKGLFMRPRIPTER